MESIQVTHEMMVEMGFYRDPRPSGDDKFYIRPTETDEVFIGIDLNEVKTMGDLTEAIVKNSIKAGRFIDRAAAIGPCADELGYVFY